MKKVCVVGHFGFGEELANGQTIKTKIVTQELENQLTANEIDKIDTHGSVLNMPRVACSLLRKFCTCENIVLFPAQNGVRFFAPLCALLNLGFHRKLHYVVIGGWLNEFLETNRSVERALMVFTGIYVETSTMKMALERRGMKNVHLMPNFKNLPILSSDQLVYSSNEPYRLCTFSRVMREKGIDAAAKAVETVNERIGRTVYELDIYGQVESGQIPWFEELEASFPDYIRYKGIVAFDQSVDVLKDYFALLFPTEFFTEGIPGTILDAYAAGLPVISSKWGSFSDIVSDGITGFGFKFGNWNELVEILLKVAENPNLILEQKEHCLERAVQYKPNHVVQTLLERF